jgi:hypothetical protein
LKNTQVVSRPDWIHQLVTQLLTFRLVENLVVQPRDLAIADFDFVQQPLFIVLNRLAIEFFD